MTVVKQTNGTENGTSSSNSLQNFYDNFTPSALADELTLRLSSKFECDIFEDKSRQSYLSIFRPYIEQAKNKIYHINVFNPPPEFIIKENDIPQTLALALKKLDFFLMNQIVTEAVIRIYEAVDHDYFHINGLYGKIKWRFAMK